MRLALRLILLVLTIAAAAPAPPAAANYLNGQLFSQTLDIRQLPGQLKTYKPGGATAVWQTYTYDVRRKIDAITDGVAANESRDYGYDANGRLLTATGPWGTNGAQAAGSYVYDALGNVRVWTQGAKTGTVSYGDATNRVTSYAKTGEATRSFTYDTRGNTAGNGDNTFTYDFANQPVSVGGAVPAAHAYDGNFKRVKTVENGKTVYQVFSRVTGGLVYRDEVTDGETTDYASVGGAALRLKKVGPTVTPEYTHFDHQGSAVAATNASGAILWRERYSPFGTRLLKPAGNKGDTGYTGHLMDAATELVYMQARYYDSQIQRFYSTDPVGYEDQLNLYAYVGNDPVNKTDPTGMKSFLMCRTVAGAGAHCFIAVTNGDGSLRKRFSFGPQRNERSDPGQLVETRGSGLSTDEDDGIALETGGKGRFRTINLNSLGFADDDVVAAGEKVDGLLGTPGDPGPTAYKFDANGKQRGRANSNGGTARVLEEADPDAANKVQWPTGAIGRNSSNQVGVSPNQDPEPFNGFIDNDTIVGNRCTGRLDC